MNLFDARDHWRKELAALDTEGLLAACKSALRLSARSTDPLDREYRNECWSETSRRKLPEIWAKAVTEIDAERRRERLANVDAIRELRGKGLTP